MVKNVLIVDDYEGTALVLSKSFNLNGIDADFCTTMKQAFEMLGKKKYDYVILDIFIEGDPGGGITLCNYIQSEFPSYKIVFITGVEKDSKFVIEAQSKAPVIYKSFNLKKFVKDISEGSYEKALTT